MRKRVDLGLLGLLLAGCIEPSPEQEPTTQAPKPIGHALVSIEGAWSNCSGGLHLYREGQQLQSQCFGPDNAFVYENRGTLTADAATTLDQHLAEADLDDIEPVNHRGLCGASDSVASFTVWVGEDRIAFDQSCVPQGVLSLYEHTMAVWTELSGCGEELPVLLDSIEPGCRSS